MGENLNAVTKEGTTTFLKSKDCIGDSAWYDWRSRRLDETILHFAY